MVDPDVAATLMVDGTFAVIVAVLFTYVGTLVAHRPTNEANRSARIAFVLWWASMALVTFGGALRSFLVAMGADALFLHVTLSQFLLVAISVGLWGLFYYLAFIHAGSSRIFLPSIVGYVLVYLFLVGLVAWLDPVSVEAEPWRVSLTYQNTLSPAMTALSLVVLLGPVLVILVGYGALLFRTNDRQVRFRVGVTSLAFFLWFGSSALASSAGLNDMRYWPLVSRAISVGAAALVILAYRPPRGLAARLKANDATGSAE